MAAIPIYVFAGAHSTADMLNAVAMFAGDNNYLELISIFGLVGIVLLAMKMLATGNYQIMFNWAVTYVVVMALCIVPKTDVMVIDLSDNTSFQQVDNVPLALGVIASELSTISYGLSQFISDVYHAPKDQEYTKTGFLFGSQLVQTTLQAQMPDANTMALWDRYTAQCILPDIALARVNPNKYTMSQLANAPDIFSFLANHNPSPLRGIYIDSNFNTCQQALPQLKAKFEAQANESLTFLGKTYYPNRQQLQDNIKTLVSNTYNYMFGMSNSAQQDLVQNMAVNSLKQGLKAAAAESDAGAALNYAVSQAQKQETASYLTMGQLAEVNLPEMQSILFTFLLAMFPFFVIFSFIPDMGLKVLKEYIVGLIFLCSLPVTYTVLHYLMLSELASSGNTYGSIYKGITLSNINPIAAKHTQMASIAGYLMSLTTFLTYIIVRGLAQGMVSMSERLGALANSGVSSTAHQWTDGSLSLNSSQVGNHTWDSITANKHDLAPVDRFNSASYQRGDGATVTQFANGQISVDQPNSNLRSGINVSQSISDSLQHSLADAHKATLSDRNSLGMSSARTTNDLYQLGDNISHGQTQGIQMSESQQAAFTKAYQENQNVVDQVMKNTGMSHDEASKVLKSAYAKGNLHTEVGLPFLAKLISPASGNVSADFGGGITGESSHSDVDMNSKQLQEAESLMKSYSDSMNTMTSIATNSTVTDSSSRTGAVLHNFSDDYRQTQDYSRQVSADEAREKSLSAALSQAKTNSASINENANFDYVNMLKDRFPQHYADILNDSSPANAAIHQSTQQDFVNKKVADFNKEFGIGANTFGSNQIDNANAQNKSNLDFSAQNTNGNAAYHTDTFKDNHAQGGSALYEKASDKGIKFDQNTYDQQVAQSQQSLDSGASQVNNKGAGLKASAHARNQSIKDALQQDGVLPQSEVLKNMPSANQSASELDMNQLNSNAAEENGKITKEAWSNLFGSNKGDK
ncbi:conjugal transfer protein TraG N-terminal domain-containing protein [Fangia hongkongensis]|uniref:conjugal transfer protein TraG N-terminal domain-containing protein n=1 Tax=Fangia hongkongensis TaxID=270495 RepID=UPI00037FA614|nr:conjugal transfer protein TraG N-terminal domain-containing protein [Fangia hongkongensis]MBK2125045.1 conjugal transfer protein TraG N-terminal domain-containing protein [Fangia hongkongensis]